MAKRRLSWYEQGVRTSMSVDAQALGADDSATSIESSRLFYGLTETVASRLKGQKEIPEAS